MYIVTYETAEGKILDVSSRPGQTDIAATTASDTYNFMDLFLNYKVDVSTGEIIPKV